MRDPGLLEQVIRNIILLHFVGIRIVLVHGGGPEIDRLTARLGIEKQVVRGLRVTDDNTMEAVEMALLRANQSLVAAIQRAGGQAVGLSGRDAGLLQGWPISQDLGRAGQVNKVRGAILDTLLEQGFLPVVCTVASDAQFEPLNVNADSAAAAIAAAIHAQKLILMTDTNGVLADPADPNSTMSQITSALAQEMIRSGAASKGMIPKLEAALEAVDAGVRGVHLINGSTPNALLMEVLTDAGIGTMVTR